MSARIVQIDLSAPLSAIHSRRDQTLLLLVRFGLQPLGWVKCELGRGGEVHPDQLAQLIAQSLARELHDAARQRLFDSPQHSPAGGATDTLLLFEEGVRVDRHFHDALAHSYTDPRVQCVFGDVWPGSVDAAWLTRLVSAPRRRFERRVMAPLAWSTLFARAPRRFQPGMALTVRRCTFEALGGFDAALRGDAARCDLITRILRSGGSVVHDPRALAFSNRRGAASVLSRQSFARSFEDAAYCGKYFNDPELANQGIRMWRGLLAQSLRAFDIGGLAGALLGVRAYRRTRKHVQRHDLTPSKVKKAA